MNSSMERPRKKGWQRKPRRQMLRSGICIEQIGSEYICVTGIYFTCLQNRGSHNPLTENNNGLNVSQLHMKLGQHSVLLKVHHQDIQHHCGIKNQANVHKSGYNQNVDEAFLEHRCNFRSALMNAKKVCQLLIHCYVSVSECYMYQECITPCSCCIHLVLNGTYLIPAWDHIPLCISGS